MFEVVPVLMGNPPYNTCWIVKLSNSDHNRLILQDMIHFVQLLSAVMDVGAHGHLFCSLLQFKPWYELLLGEVENVVKEEHVVEGEEAQSQRKKVFEAEGNVLP